jgi:hypothetical protein
MDIYENIIIGNFLYGLGFQIGAGSVGKPHAMAINLLQQTPQDRSLADLLIQGASVFRLIEFKRLRNKSPKERAKHLLISGSVKGEPHLQSFAMRCHWYVETELGKDEFQSWVRPYLLLPDRSKNGTMEQLIQLTARDALSGSRDEKERAKFRAYIELLLRINGYSGEGSGALIFATSGDGSGNPKYVAVRNLLDLIKTDRTIMREYQQIDMTRASEAIVQRSEPTLTQRPTRGRGFSRSRGFGMDMD